MFKDILALATTIAGSAMSVGHLAQAWRIWKRKSGSDVSLITYGIFFFGSFVYLWYGLLIDEWPLIIPFAIALFGTSSVILLSLRYRQKAPVRRK